MADIRIKDLATTASTTASDDFLAVDGTTNGTRKLSAATPSFATSVTVPGVVGPTSTDLTLTGGSTGASLVLGATTSGIATLKSLGTGRTVISSALGATTPTVAIYNDTPNARTTLGIIGNGGSSQAVLQFGFGAAASPTLTSNIFTNTTDFQFNAVAGSNIAFVVGATEAARFAPSTGNLLIGTTTDAASLSGGLVVNGSGAGAAASSTTTGALRVTGGVGVSGAGYFGGALNAPSLTGAASTDLALNGGSGTSNVVLTASGAGGNVYARPGASGYVRVDTGLGMRVESGTLNVTTTTSASSSTVGALTIGNGTAATNVAIGAGNVNAGGTGTFGANTIVSSTGVRVTNGGAYRKDYTVAGTAAVPVVEAAVTDNSNPSGLYIANAFSSNSSSWPVLRYTDTAGTVTTGLSLGPTGAVSIANSTPSTGVGSGALQVAGGIYAGAASVFNSTASFGGVTTPYSGVSVSVKGAVANAAIYISDAAGTTPGTTSPGVFFASSVKGGYFRNASGVIQLIDESSPGAGDGAVRTSVNMTTGAATFAGAVSIGNTVAVAAAVASTHKVTMVIGGVTYYLLATNV